MISQETIRTDLIPLAPRELIPLFAELSATRRARGELVDGLPNDVQAKEDELYALLLDRFRIAAAVVEVREQEVPA